jgi:hypothetical protein
MLGWVMMMAAGTPKQVSECHRKLFVSGNITPARRRRRKKGKVKNGKTR